MRAFELVARSLRFRVGSLASSVPVSAGALLSLLEQLGCCVEWCDSVETSFADGTTIVLILLPPRDTLHVAREVLLGKEGVVSAFFGPDLPHGEVAEILAAGAVCYLRDTEDPTEAAARLLATLRRGISGEYPRIVASFVRVGVLELDPDALTLMGPSGSIRVTETESRIFSFLASSPRSTAEDLASVVLNRRDVVGRGRDLVYRHIANLRAKIRLVGAEGSLEHRGTGYRLRPLSKR